jgi:hypothetical protein
LRPPKTGHFPDFPALPIFPNLETASLRGTIGGWGKITITFAEDRRTFWNLSQEEFLSSKEKFAERIFSPLVNITQRIAILRYKLC